MIAPASHTPPKRGRSTKALAAANDNGGRRVIVRLAAPSAITTAEVEVFGAILSDLEALAANDNHALWGHRSEPT